MILKPLPNSKNVNDTPPPRKCEACGTIVAVGHDAINVIIVVGSPGHPSLAPFQCGYEEHWACSIECWQKVAHACIDEHMRVMLQELHDKAGL